MNKFDNIFTDCPLCNHICSARVPLKKTAYRTNVFFCENCKRYFRRKRNKIYYAVEME